MFDLFNFSWVNFVSQKMFVLTLLCELDFCSFK